MPFGLWLVDHPPFPAGWTEKRKAGIGGALKQHFDMVCTSPNTSYGSCTFSWAGSLGQRRSDHLVLHFFNTARNGILYMWGFRNGLTESGATVWVDGKGMMSEIYLDKMEGDARFEQLVANLAFHEAMHNKLDAHPTLRSMADIHKLKNGGLSRQTGIAAGTKLSQADVNAMAPALTRQVPQF